MHSVWPESERCIRKTAQCTRNVVDVVADLFVRGEKLVVGGCLEHRDINKPLFVTTNACGPGSLTARAEKLCFFVLFFGAAGGNCYFFLVLLVVPGEGRCVCVMLQVVVLITVGPMPAVCGSSY